MQKKKRELHVKKEKKKKELTDVVWSSSNKSNAFSYSCKFKKDWKAQEIEEESEED